jgi:hypothetical protein
MNILLKYPTRGRPTLFLRTLIGWLELAEDLSRLKVLISYDSDDLTMNDSVLDEARQLHPAIVAVKGHNHDKISACNADLPAYQEPWDVVLLLSDDMFCKAQGWDTTIRGLMTQHFPDTDGALWFFDGAQCGFNSLECVGRKRYERFGYLYHPSYKGFYCDFESTEVGLRDGRLVFIETPICSHENPCWSGELKFDATYTRSLVWNSLDRNNYDRRKLAGFPREP